MKIKSLLGTLALSLGLLASPAAAEKFVVGFQPYDTISYQAIVNAELGLWKKYTPAGTEIEFQPALQGTVVANTANCSSSFRSSPSPSIISWYLAWIFLIFPAIFSPFSAAR